MTSVKLFGQYSATNFIGKKGIEHGRERITRQVYMAIEVIPSLKYFLGTQKII